MHHWLLSSQEKSRHTGCRGIVGALFDLTTLLRSGTTINLTFLRKFLSETVPAIYTVEEKKEVTLLSLTIKRCLYCSAKTCSFWGIFDRNMRTDAA